MENRKFDFAELLRTIVIETAQGRIIPVWAQVIYVGLWLVALAIIIFAPYLMPWLENQAWRGGLFFKYQTLFASMITLFAASFVFLVPVLESSIRKKEAEREFRHRMHALIMQLDTSIAELLKPQPRAVHEITIDDLIHCDTSVTDVPFFWAPADGSFVVAIKNGKAFVNRASRILKKIDINDYNHPVDRAIFSTAVQAYCIALEYFCDAMKFESLNYERIKEISKADEVNVKLRMI